MKKMSKKMEKLTVMLAIPVAPSLKAAVDEAAIAEGLPTNEWVARHLAAILRKPELGLIPRKAMGRPRKLERVAS